MEKLKWGPRALHYESRLKYKKIFSILPKLLINAELYDLLLGPSLNKRDTIEFVKPICDP
jgi:hypothetical protein